MMRRTICLVLTLAFLLAFAACSRAGKEEGSSIGGSETPSNPEISQTEQGTPPAVSPVEPGPFSQELQEPDREPIGGPAVIAYPEFLTEELIASRLYQQALTRPSVIVYQDEVVTDPQPVYDFLAAAERGEDWDLYYYNFSASSFEETTSVSIRFLHFISNGGDLTMRSEYQQSWEEMTEKSRPSYGIREIRLNDYGYLNYRNEGTKVINDRDLYDNARDRQQMLETYLYPIYYTGIGCGSTWASPQRLNQTLLFSDIYSYEHDNFVWNEFGDNWPVDYMVETLSRYFDGVTADVILSSFKPGRDPYDPQTNTIYFIDGRGGAIPPARVTGWNQEGDTLRIDYECYYYDTGLPIENFFRCLTVRLMPDGSFRYISNLER